MIGAKLLSANHLLEPLWQTRVGKDSLKKLGSFAKKSSTQSISVRNERAFTCSMGNSSPTFSGKILVIPDGTRTAFLSLSRRRKDVVGFMSRRASRMRGKQIRLSLTRRQDLDVSSFSKVRRNHAGLSPAATDGGIPTSTGCGKILGARSVENLGSNTAKESH